MTATPRRARGSCELESFGLQPSRVRGGHELAEPTLLVPFGNRNYGAVLGPETGSISLGRQLLSKNGWSGL